MKEAERTPSSWDRRAALPSRLHGQKGNIEMVEKTAALRHQSSLSVHESYYCAPTLFKGSAISKIAELSGR